MRSVFSLNLASNNSLVRVATTSGMARASKTFCFICILDHAPVAKRNF
jgi:hypothetical protein